MIVSADKDLSQLLFEHDEQWDYARNQRWDMHGVKARYGVHAHQIADYLALCGDAIDNIPGVTGIGAKSAAILLAHFGSLDALLERVDELPFCACVAPRKWRCGCANNANTPCCGASSAPLRSMRRWR